jgi:hypothetical protein
VFVAAGALTMTSSGGERAKYNAKDLLARCVVGLVAAHFSQLIAAKMIELSNALTAALTDTPTGPNGGLDGIKANLSAARDTSGALLFVVCAAVIVFLVAATALSMIGRFALVMVLTTVAPIALACHALPQTDPVARMWWRAYLGTLTVPIVQGAFLAAGQWMLLDPRHMLPQLGLPATEPGGVLNLFVVIVLLFSAVKVPGWMRKIVMSPGGRGQNILATALRVIVIQRVSKVLPGVRRIPG